MQRAICLSLLIVFFLGSSIFAQGIERLIERYNTAETPESKAEIAFQLGLTYEAQQVYGKAIEYYESAARLMQDIPIDRFGYAQRIEIMERNAACYAELKEYKKAENIYRQILFIYRQWGSTQGQLRTLEALAEISSQAEDYRRALEYTEQALALAQRAGDKRSLFKLYNNIGFLHKRVSSPNRSLEAFENAYRLAKDNPDVFSESEQAVVLENIGVLYTNLRRYDEAAQYYEQALALVQRSDDKAEMAKVYNYIAINEMLSNRLNRAFTVAEAAVKLATEIRRDDILVSSYEVMENLYKQRRRFDKAAEYEKKRLELVNRLELEEELRRKEQLRYQLEVTQKEYALRTAQYEREIQLAEAARLRQESELAAARARAEEEERKRVERELELERQRRQAAEREQEAERRRIALENAQREASVQAQLREEAERARIEAERAQQAIAEKARLQEEALRQAELAAAREREIKQYLSYIIALLGLVVLAVAWGFYQSRRLNRQLAAKNAEIERQRQEIALQNAQMQSSIRAARVIQQAVLPSKAIFSVLFKEHFVIFLPKDVVSGDFYWVYAKGIKKIVASVDCTGHGVPGAFMSLIGNTLLDKLIKLQNMTDPDAVLEKLHKEVRLALHQEESENRDGMDVALVTIEDKEQNQVLVSFAGARRPLYYIERGTNTVKVVKGTRRSVGGIQNEDLRFERHEILIPKGSYLYLGSDGYVDQNNAERKKFGEKAFISLLESIAHQPLEEQKEILEKSLRDYMRGTEQRDDISLVAVRV